MSKIHGRPRQLGWPFFRGGLRLAGLGCNGYSAAKAPVAQLDRALPSEGRGQRFESSRVRQDTLKNSRLAFGPGLTLGLLF